MHLFASLLYGIYDNHTNSTSTYEYYPGNCKPIHFLPRAWDLRLGMLCSRTNDQGPGARPSGTAGRRDGGTTKYCDIAAMYKYKYMYIRYMHVLHMYCIQVHTLCNSKLCNERLHIQRKIGCWVGWTRISGMDHDYSYHIYRHDACCRAMQCCTSTTLRMHM